MHLEDDERLVLVGRSKGQQTHRAPCPGLHGNRAQFALLGMPGQGKGGTEFSCSPGRSCVQVWTTSIDSFVPSVGCLAYPGSRATS